MIDIYEGGKQLLDQLDSHRIAVSRAVHPKYSKFLLPLHDDLVCLRSLRLLRRHEIAE